MTIWIAAPENWGAHAVVDAVNRKAARENGNAHTGVGAARRRIAVVGAVCRNVATAMATRWTAATAQGGAHKAMGATENISAHSLMGVARRKTTEIRSANSVTQNIARNWQKMVFYVLLFLINANTIFSFKIAVVLLIQRVNHPQETNRLHVRLTGDFKWEGAR